MKLLDKITLPFLFTSGPTAHNSGAKKYHTDIIVSAVPRTNTVKNLISAIVFPMISRNILPIPRSTSGNHPVFGLPKSGLAKARQCR